MADEVEHRGSDVPPPGETIHLPAPSYLPVLTALGITIALVGIVIAWFLVVIGVLITLIVVFRWIRETRQDISELPVEH